MTAPTSTWTAISPANSGSAKDHITSPKLSLVFGPWAETEFFINAGRGFHENDARGTTITVDPVDGVTAADPVRPMVRANGAEIGMRTGLLPYTQLAITAWALDLDSELIYVGDAGATEASRATERHGVELGVFFMPHRLADPRCGPRLVPWPLQRARPRGQLHSRRGGKRRVGRRGRATSRAAGSAERASAISGPRRSSKTTACDRTRPRW